MYITYCITLRIVVHYVRSILRRAEVLLRVSCRKVMKFLSMSSKSVFFRLKVWQNL